MQIRAARCGAGLRHGRKAASFALWSGAEGGTLKKQDLYAAMIERMRAADAAGFHLEASWLAYAILEDRTSSMLRALGKTPRPKDALYDKTVALAWRAGEKDSALGVYFRDGVLTTSEPRDKTTGRVSNVVGIPWRRAPGM